MSVADAAHPHITITSIAPSSGPSAGGTQVTIKGTGFTNLDTVRLGWARLQNITVSADGTTITGTTRAVNSMGGVVDVRVLCHCHGLSGDAVLPKAFTYLPHPHILVQSITPNTGPVTGGTQVVIAGYGFQNLASVTIGGNPLQNPTVDALGQTITGLTAPAAAPGAEDVVVQCKCHGPGSNQSVLPNGFTYTAASPATQIAYASGDLQKGVAGTPLANPLVVVVKDANNAPVAGFQVTFAVAAGGGKLSATQVATDANGQASSALTLGATVGPNQVTATATGLTGSPVTFNSTGIAGAAAVVAVSSGNNQSATVGTALTNPLVVVVTDANKNPVANFNVTFAVATGGGALSATAVATDANGLAQTSLTVGKTAGANTVTATATGLTGSPITFTEKGTAGPAAAIAVVSGDKQQGAVGTPLAAPLVIVVTDANQNPVANFNVTFAVATGGGTLSAANVATAANGQAQTSLTLGAAPTVNTVTATATGLTGSPITFTETGLASPATQIALFSGDKQVGVAGSALTNPLTVVVKDANNLPVANFNVTFAVATGAGALSATTVPTDANGYAKSTLTLGTAAGPNSVTATATGLTGSPITFTATGQAGPGTQIAVVSGDKQQGVVSTKLANPLVVLVTDANNNPVTGFNVTFAVATGGGTLSVNAAVPTGANGQAAASLTLGPTVTANTVTATATGLKGSPITFTETALASAATQIALVSGDKQVGIAGSPLAAASVVIVKDVNNNPVAGFTVTFAAATGGGKLSATAVVTDGTGQASTILTLGTTAGPNTVTATAAGLTGSPITFTSTGNAGAATQIAIVSGNNQQGAVSSKLANPLVVLVTDANKNPVANFNVAFAVATGGGTLSVNAAVPTGANGQAQASLTLGPTVTANTVTATATGLTGSPLTFTETAVAAPATQIALVSGDKQVGVAGSALTNPCVVIVKDANNNPVAGFAVTFAAATGGGKLSATAVVTDGTGQAATTLTLGVTAGPNTVTATATGLTGSPITFSSTGQAGPATQISIVSGNNQQGVVATALANPLVVAVADVNNNPVAGVPVTFAVATGGGTVSSPVAVPTGANGQAMVALTLGATVTPNTVTASATGLKGSPLTFTETALAAAATQIALVSGDKQNGVAGTALTNACIVVVKDVNNNPVAGFTVTFAAATGGGKLSASAVVTDGTGQAKSTLTLGTTAGPNTVTATATGLTGSPITFTETGTAGTATQIALSAGNNQAGAVGTQLTNALVVVVKDVNGNPVQNFNVTFAVATGGGALSTNTPVATDVNGLAATKLTLGATAGANTVTATATGLTGSPITFTESATAGTATQIAISAGNNQSAPVGSTLPNALVVVVKDANNNPVQGFNVTFAVALGGGAVSTNTPVATDVNGLASTKLTLGTTVTANTVTATATGLTGSPITFTETALAANATQIALVSGNAQNGVAGTALATPFIVVVKDANNNPVTGFNVTFAVATGGGAVSGGVVATDATGQAKSTLTLGKTAGPNSVTATATGLTGSPITFTATGTAGTATQIAISSGNNQAGVSGTQLTNALVVVVKDVNGNVVQGFNVAFAAATGGGTLTATAVATDVNGLASTKLTLGVVDGANTVTATATGLTGSPITFTETGNSGAAKAVAVVSGNNQVGVAGSALTNAFVVLVTDANNNPVSGFNVTFAVATGGGSLTGSVQNVVVATAANGQATTKLTLGKTAGGNTVSATATGLTGSPITFTATGNAGPATVVAIVSGNGQNGTAGSALGNPLVVVVNDVNGNPVAGNIVMFAVATGGGTLSTTAVATGANGQSSTALTLGSAAGTNTVTATATGVGTPVTFTETGAAKQLTYTTDIQPLMAKQLCSVCHIAGGPAAFTPLSTYTQVRFGVTAITQPAGSPILVPGNAAASVIIQKLTPPLGTMYTNLGTDDPTRLANLQIITDWINQGAFNSAPGAATQIAMSSGNAQSGNAGTPLPQRLAVEVMDANLNPVPGVNVAFAAATGGGSLSNIAAVTTAYGYAAATLTPGVGANTVTASSSGLAGSPLTFTETGNAVNGFTGGVLAGSANPLDQAALVALQANSINPAALSSDPEFILRVTTVLVGRVPTAAELSAFLADNTATKRSTVINNLLASPDFAAHWATDIIGPWTGVAPVENKDQTNNPVTYNFDATLQSELMNDTPLSTLVTELATGTNTTGMAWDAHWNSLYANFNNGVLSSRDEAPTFATDRLMWAFTGMSSRCARCHNHHLTTTADDPQWLGADNYALYAYQVDDSTFACVYTGKTDTRSSTPTQPRFVADGYANAPAGQPTLGTNSSGVDISASTAARRAAFGTVFAKSTAFARGTSHRIWSEIATQLLDPNQFLAANLAADQTPALLAALTTQFKASNTQLKAFLRVCLNSTLWQLSAASPSQAADPYQGRYVIRRQHAETVSNGINEVLNGSPNGSPVQIISDLFGYPGRNQGNNNAIKDRSDALNLAQALVQMNSDQSTPGIVNNATFLKNLAAQVDGGAVMTIIPSTALVSAGGTPGLDGNYYQGANNFTSGTPFHRVDATVNFPDFTQAAVLPAGYGPTLFSVVWTGSVKITTAGAYTFTVTADDGVTLSIDGNLLINHLVDEGPTSYSTAALNLSAGNHTIKMQFYQNGGGATAQLSWSSPVLNGGPMTYDQAAAQLVQAVLQRQPTAAEVSAIDTARAASPNTLAALQDLAVALTSSAEFIMR